MNSINKNIYCRSVSPNEYLYAHIQQLYNTFAIQYVIEGIGYLSLEDLKKAVGQSIEASPGANLILDKKKKMWIESNHNILIHSLNTSEFLNKFNLNHNIFLKKNSPFSKRPSTEILLIPTNTYRVIIRSFHGQMDGKGLLIFVNNLFKALRGQELCIARSNETDLSFLTKLDGFKKKIEMKCNYKVFKKKHIFFK